MYINTYLEINFGTNNFLGNGKLASDGEGKGNTFLEEIPRCCRLMCELKQLRFLDNFPHTVHLNPGPEYVCISSMCLFIQLAFSTLPHLGQAFRSVVIVELTPNTKYKKKYISQERALVSGAEGGCNSTPTF